MLTARGLTVRLKRAAEPVNQFLQEGERPRKFIKEVCFYRIIGMDGSDAAYLESIRKLDEVLWEKAYLRLDNLEPAPPPDLLQKHAGAYDSWAAIPSGDLAAQFAYPFPAAFPDSDTLEWTMKQAFSKTIEAYRKGQAGATDSMARNFGVKLLFWIGRYLPALYNDAAKKMLTFPKCVFVGEIKKQEGLFLYFLAQLGCDILYFGCEKDIDPMFLDVLDLSAVFELGPRRKCGMPIPAYNPAQYRHDPIAAASRIAVPAPPPRQAPPARPPEPPVQRPATITTAPPPAQSQRPGTGRPAEAEPAGKELSYEELAGFSESVVMIKVMDQSGTCGKSGSGVIINPEGFILTNQHVVAGGSRFVVRFENDEREYVSNVLVKYHTDYDLALIRVDRPCKHIALLEPPGKLARGQKIVAIGSPLGLFNTVSDGIISAFRQIDAKAMIQFTAPISNGSSGGALLDMRGRLVGLITAGFDQGQNLNLAVDYVTIRQFVQNFL